MDLEGFWESFVFGSCSELCLGPVRCVVTSSFFSASVAVEKEVAV